LDMAGGCESNPGSDLRHRNTRNIYRSIHVFPGLEAKRYQDFLAKAGQGPDLRPQASALSKRNEGPIRS
jgi:hypothetical protein